MFFFKKNITRLISFDFDLLCYKISVLILHLLIFGNFNYFFIDIVDILLYLSASNQHSIDIKLVSMEKRLALSKKQDEI